MSDKSNDAAHVRFEKLVNDIHTIDSLEGMKKLQTSA